MKFSVLILLAALTLSHAPQAEAKNYTLQFVCQVSPAQTISLWGVGYDWKLVDYLWNTPDSGRSTPLLFQGRDANGINVYATEVTENGRAVYTVEFLSPKPVVKNSAGQVIASCWEYTPEPPMDGGEVDP